MEVMKIEIGRMACSLGELNQPCPSGPSSEKSTSMAASLTKDPGTSDRRQLAQNSGNLKSASAKPFKVEAHTTPSPNNLEAVVLASADNDALERGNQVRESLYNPHKSTAPTDTFHQDQHDDAVVDDEDSERSSEDEELLGRLKLNPMRQVSMGRAYFDHLHGTISSLTLTAHLHKVGAESVVGEPDSEVAKEHRQRELERHAIACKQLENALEQIEVTKSFNCLNDDEVVFLRTIPKKVASAYKRLESAKQKASGSSATKRQAHLMEGPTKKQKTVHMVDQP